jgi:hypothetical protein
MSTSEYGIILAEVSTDIIEFNYYFLVLVSISEKILPIISRPLMQTIAL